MSNSSEVSVAHHASRPSRRMLTRSILTSVGALGILLASTHASAAQTAEPRAKSWELRVSDGAFVPTGSQRSILKDAHATAAQLSWLVRPSLAVTGTFGWARSRDLASADTPKLDVFSSDIGVEARGGQRFADRAVTLSPFAGVGAGARSYNYRSLDVDATNNLAGYGAMGGEVGMGRVGLRVEVRDYLAGFKPIGGAGRSGTRNDVMIMTALRFDRHRASKE